MQIKKLLVAAVIPFALLGCPDKGTAPKPDPAASAVKPAATGATPAATAAASAKSGGGW